MLNFLSNNYIVCNAITLICTDKFVQNSMTNTRAVHVSHLTTTRTAARGVAIWDQFLIQKWSGNDAFVGETSRCRIYQQPRWLAAGV